MGLVPTALVVYNRGFCVDVLAAHNGSDLSDWDVTQSAPSATNNCVACRGCAASKDLSTAMLTGIGTLAGYTAGVPVALAKL